MSVAEKKNFFENLIASGKSEDGGYVQRYRTQTKQNGDKSYTQEDEKGESREGSQTDSEKKKHSEIHTTHVQNQGVSRADKPESSDTANKSKSRSLAPTSSEKEQLDAIVEDKVLAANEDDSEDDDVTQVKTAAELDVRSEDEHIDSNDHLQDQFRTLLQIDSGLSASESLGSRSSSKLSLLSSSEETTAFMVDAYKNVIKHHFKVTEILPYLPLIDKTHADMIRSKHNFCASDAVELLLETMKSSKADGIWQSFLDALDKLEHTHLRKLLSNETETHYNFKSEILRLVAPELQQRLYFPDFLDVVYEKELLTEAEKDEVEILLKSKGPIPAAGLLLEKVDKHTSDWDKVFVDVLEQFSMADIASAFKMIEENEQPKLQAETTLIQPKKKRKREKKKKRIAEQNRNTHDTEEVYRGTINEIPDGTGGDLVENPSERLDDSLEETSLYSVVTRIQRDLNAGFNRISEKLQEMRTAVSSLEEKVVNQTECFSRDDQSRQGENSTNSVSKK